MSAPSISGPVARRKVFYIPGFDPFHPRRYRELYRTEGKAQAGISGYLLDVSARASAQEGFGWQARLCENGEATDAEFEVLRWSDVVQGSMGHGIMATYIQLVKTAWIYIGTGALASMMRLRKGPMLAAFYPVVMLLAQLALALAAGAALGWMLSAALVEAGMSTWSARFVALLAGGAVAWVVLRWFKLNDGRFFVYYLMHDFAFSARHGGAYPALLEARIRYFVQRLRDSLTEDWDEVLVVGHSSGAHLGVTTLADLLRPGLPGRHPPLAFLTLGHAVPMASFLPNARRLRGDLQFLSEQSNLTWVDVSAPGDGCTFALCDPVAVSGVARPAQRWPLVISGAFRQTLSPKRWRALRWRFFRLHFQYLCAFDRPRDYDYFRITSGALTLAARYAGRKPSPSRITRVVSRHRSVEPVQ